MMEIEQKELVESLGRLKEGDICVLKLTRKFATKEDYQAFLQHMRAQFADVGCKVVILDHYVDLAYPREVHVNVVN